MLFLRLVRIIRAQKKNTRAHNKSQSATITQNQEASSLSLLTQPSKTTQPQHPIPLFPEHKNTLSNNKARKYIHKTSRLTLIRIQKLKVKQSFQFLHDLLEEHGHNLEKNIRHFFSTT